MTLALEIEGLCPAVSSVADPDTDPSDLYVMGLLGPDPDPLVSRCMDPDPSIIKQK